MSNFNEYFFSGNLCADPELRYTPQGTAVCDFNVASNGYKGKAADGSAKQEVLFMTVTAWAKLAESVAEYRRKGDPVTIRGRIVYESWTDKKSGDVRGKHKVVAEKIEFNNRSSHSQSKSEECPL